MSRAVSLLIINRMKKRVNCKWRMKRKKEEYPPRGRATWHDILALHNKRNKVVGDLWRHQPGRPDLWTGNNVSRTGPDKYPAGQQPRGERGRP